MPLINLKILIGFFMFFISNPNKVFKILRDVLRESNSIKIFLRNVSVIPKAVYISKVLENADTSHIHAHWATIQTTFALIISKILEVPFSFTAHRYDIGENNMLRKKVLDATFVRAISKEAKDEIIELTNLYELAHKIQVIHIGVPVLPFQKKQVLRDMHVIACPANLVEKKGQRYLVEACALLKQRQFNFKCLLIGDGPDKDKINSLISEQDLGDCVLLEGYYPHSKLMKMLEEKQIDLVVLPSIITKEGFREGIPVTLMEAMSFGIPVISTNTGGISELLEDNAGIMIPEKDSIALAEAIYKVLADKEIRRQLIQNGYARVYNEFSLDKCSERLVTCIQNNLKSLSMKKLRAI